MYFLFALAGHRGTCLRPLHIFALLFALIEQSCSTRSSTRPHVHWRTTERERERERERVKTATPYITLQWQLSDFSCHIAAELIMYCPCAGV